MAKRYRYAFAKKKEAGKGKAVGGSCRGFLSPVFSSRSSFLFSGREIRIYCGKRKPFCGAVVRLRIYYGTFRLFRRKL